MYKFKRKSTSINSAAYYKTIKPEFLNKVRVLNQEIPKIKTFKQFKTLYIKCLRLYIEYKLTADYTSYFITYETFPGICAMVHLTNAKITNKTRDLKIKNISEKFTDELINQISIIRENFHYKGKVYNLNKRLYFQHDLIKNKLIPNKPKNLKERKQFIKAYLPFQQSLIQKLFEFIHSFNIEELSK